jgi:membrane protein DedA with SNARE-associated domain
MPVASIVSDVTDAVTSAIGDYGLYAVFVLMFVDAFLPAASEVVMVYAGAVASGAFANQDVVLFGHQFDSGFPAYVAVALSGTLGYTLGSIAGWALGRYGGRPYIEGHGRWLHLDRERLDRAEEWFDRWEDWAVFLGRLTPLVRSFVSIPAGVLEARFVRYVLLTLAGSAIWCFAFAGVGWAVGRSWESAHHDFRAFDYLVIAGIVLVAAYAILRKRRSSRLARRAQDPAR